MLTSYLQVLGKEHLGLRKRPDDEVESSITVPSTLNGQVASGEVNRYRFEASKGQRLVVSVDARQLIPYIADAVPGWFQPVLMLQDANGREVAFSDDYRFKPDPTLCYEVPQDGQYLLTIADALYRGREDFVYRITIGEVPFITSVFPLGGRVGDPQTVEMDGWNLDGAELTLPADDAEPGIHRVTANKEGFVSNAVPFALSTLPEFFEEESNDDPSHAQKVTLPIIVNGRTDQPDDWDVFQVEGHAGDQLVAEVYARRLESPLDSMLKITGPGGRLLALNDDFQDVGSGVNTHHADSYLMVELPEDGTYCVHIGDTARHGGKQYAYRLRISQPQPDFALRVVPSSAALRSRASAAVSVYALRKDGFAGNIKLAVKDPPSGFSSPTVSLPKNKETVRLAPRTKLQKTERPLCLTIEGHAMIGDHKVAHEAVPAEDRMQAFLWRHLVPAEDLRVLVYDPAYQPPSKRVAKPLSDEEMAKLAPADAAEKPKLNKRQVAGRLRQLKNLFEEWLITEDFYNRKVAECEAAL